MAQAMRRMQSVAPQSASSSSRACWETSSWSRYELAPGLLALAAYTPARRTVTTSSSAWASASETPSRKPPDHLEVVVVSVLEVAAAIRAAVHSLTSRDGKLNSAGITPITS